MRGLRIPAASNHQSQPTHSRSLELDPRDMGLSRHADSWAWETTPPEDWRFSVELDAGGEATGRFVSFTPVGQERLIQHTDRYRPGSWEPSSTDKVLAFGPAGIIF